MWQNERVKQTVYYFALQTRTFISLIKKTNFNLKVLQLGQLKHFALYLQIMQQNIFDLCVLIYNVNDSADNPSII